MTVPSFASHGWYRIRGRGWSVLVEADQEYDRSHPELIGQAVMVDGEIFHCVAVERNMPAPPIYPGERIGLLVREKQMERLAEIERLTRENELQREVMEEYIANGAHLNIPTVGE